MNNMIKIFENEEFGKVRTVIKDGEPWLVGKPRTDKLRLTVYLRKCMKIEPVRR